MKQYEQIHRVLAALSYASFPNDIKQATEDFTASLKIMGLKGPADPEGFVSRWGTAWADEKSLDGKASNSGRPTKLSDTQLQQILDVILNWRRDGRSGPYRSVKDIKRHSPLVKEILEAAGAGERTLRNRLHQFCPELVYQRLFVKQRLTAAHKQKRYERCCYLLELLDQQDSSVLERVVWIDAKTMYMTIRDRKGWVLMGEEDTFETTRPASKKNPIILKYYVAVNYRVGTVKLIYCTGTTGMKADRDPNRPYLVSLLSVQLRGFLVCHIRQNLFDCCCPPCLATPLLSCIQPQHIKTGLYSCLGQSPVSARPAA